MKIKNIIYIIDALLIHTLIRVGVQAVAEIIIVNNYQPLLQNVGEGTEQYQNLVTEMNQVLSQYAVIITIITACLALPILGIMYQRDQKARGNDRPITVSQSVLAGIVGIFGCIALNGVIMASGIQNNSSAYQDVTQTIYRTSFWIQIMGIGLLTPVVEELIFRGLIYRRMRSYWPAKVCVAASAVLFGIWHGNLVQFVFAFCLGILLALAMEKSQNIIVPIFMHMAVNLTSLVATAFGFFSYMFSSRLILIILVLTSIIVCSVCEKILISAKEK